MSKLELWEEEEWFAVDIDPWETELQKMDINYKQEAWASMTETKVSMTSSEDTPFSYFKRLSSRNMYLNFSGSLISYRSFLQITKKRL